jgi:serine/threonine-protein kinase
MPKTVLSDPDGISSGPTRPHGDVTATEQTPVPGHLRLAPFPVVPGYKIRRQLGSGGMGVVYLAQETGLDRLVALKLLHAPAACDPAAAARFAEEARIVARLHHPNIVPLYRFGDAGGVPFLALEYEPGPTLKHFAAGRPQPPGWAAAVVEQVARATQYAHDHGVVHRDLKPANILLAASEAPPGCRPRVVDFGLARALDGAQTGTLTGVAVGTPRYMSPEQASGRHDRIGPWSDVYALGVTLYELLTGQPPFPHADTVAALLAVRDQPPVRPARVQPGVPRDLEAICLKCLEKQPEDRYLTAGDLAADLARFRAGQAVLARRPTAAATAYRVVRRYPGVSALAAGLLVTLTAGSVASTAFYLRAERERATAVAALETARADRDAATALRATEATLRAEAEAAAKAAREEAARADAATATAQQASARLESVNQFLLRGLFAVDRPIGAGGLGPDTTLRELLDRTATRLRTAPPDPGSAPEVNFTLGQSYYAIGDWAKAECCFGRAA